MFFHPNLYFFVVMFIYIGHASQDDSYKDLPSLNNKWIHNAAERLKKHHEKMIFIIKHLFY